MDKMEIWELIIEEKKLNRQSKQWKLEISKYVKKVHVLVRKYKLYVELHNEG